MLFYITFINIITSLLSVVSLDDLNEGHVFFNKAICYSRLTPRTLICYQRAIRYYRACASSKAKHQMLEMKILGVTLTMNSIRRNIQIPGMGSRLRLVHSQQLRGLPHTLRKSRIPRRSRSSLARERDRRIHRCRDMGTLFLKLFEEGSCSSPRMSRRPSKPSIVSRKFIH